MLEPNYTPSGMKQWNESMTCLIPTEREEVLRNR